MCSSLLPEEQQPCNQHIPHPRSSSQASSTHWSEEQQPMQPVPVQRAAVARAANTHMRSSSSISNLPLSKEWQPEEQPSPSEEKQQCAACPDLRSSSHVSNPPTSEEQKPHLQPVPIQVAAAALSQPPSEEQ
uniref:Uncharacterized protein n=1 Tax=Myotis myotis TaxID=51298 RepID=A0A7J7Z519_MYOMY|nr:hypothetical protein mMyoMyo1_010540 [Myotis myotis]